MPMTKILEIDATLSELIQDVPRLAGLLEFQTVCELTDEKAIAQQLYPGLYKIDILATGSHETFRSWSSWFVSEWVRPEYERKFVPNPKKKRLAAHAELAEWIPLYLGKAKNVANRVWQHLHLPLEQPTTALKLKHRLNMTEHRFRLSTIRVDVKNYDLVLPQLERALRDKHNPILGRQ